MISTTANFLAVLSVILLSSFVMPFASQARADDFRDLDDIEALQSKWEKIKKDGLSAGDVEKLTDKLKELGGKDIDGTGVKQLLDSMNANAERLAKLKDAGDKLEKMIALVETFKNLPTGEEFDGQATVEALEDTLEIMADLASKIPPPFGTIAGPMMRAYKESVGGAADNIGAIQAAAEARDEAIAGKLPEEPPEDVEESFEFDAYPYVVCPECEEMWSIAGQSAATARNLKNDMERAQAAEQALKDQRDEIYEGAIAAGKGEAEAHIAAANHVVVVVGGRATLARALQDRGAEAARAEDKFYDADHRAKQFRQAFIACLEKCNKDQTTSRPSINPTDPGSLSVDTGSKESLRSRTEWACLPDPVTQQRGSAHNFDRSVRLTATPQKLGVHEFTAPRGTRVDISTHDKVGNGQVSLAVWQHESWIVLNTR